MERLYIGRVALTTAVIFVLAGCGGTQPLIGSPGKIPKSITASAQHAQSSRYEVLFSFNGANGKNPSAGLLDWNGKLYGTTTGGAYESQALGNVFSITTTGKEKVLYDFHLRPDGNDPAAALIEMNGKLYGTTVQGGTYDCGTVFSLTRTGKENVLHSFGFAPFSDGVNPTAALVDVNGTLYGTTLSGRGPFLGASTVFTVTPQGIETVLHRFTGYPSDGASPRAGLVYVKGLLYGTTEGGGSGKYFHNGVGTVFSITPGGAEKVVYSFNPGYSPPVKSGFDPYAGLTNVNGTLYGTTVYGGAYQCGTVFSVTRTGIEKVLHSFGYDEDGCTPYAGLVYVKGMLYGTTRDEGAYGNGTIFSVSLSGSTKVLHSFGYGSDGSAPFTGLIDVNGTLYGTTLLGGTYGDGAVFALTP